MENASFTWAGKLNVSEKSEDGEDNSIEEIKKNITKVKEKKKKSNCFNNLFLINLIYKTPNELTY